MKGKKLIEIPSHESGWGKVTPIEGGQFWEKDGVTALI
jgi:hypothetical protein